MQSTDDDDVLMTRIQEHLEHQSKLIAAALALCGVAVLSFFAGKQSFAVFSINLAFGWASIVALFAVSAAYGLAGSSLHTIFNSIRQLSFMQSASGEQTIHERKRVGLAVGLMTTPVLFNPFSLLGNRNQDSRPGGKESAYGPYGILLLTSITPFVFSSIVNTFAIPQALETFEFNRYVAKMVEMAYLSVLFGIAYLTFGYYLFFAVVAPLILTIGGTPRRIWFFVAPFAIFFLFHLGYVLVWTVKNAPLFFELGAHAGHFVMEYFVKP